MKLTPCLISLFCLLICLSSSQSFASSADAGAERKMPTPARPSEKLSLIRERGAIIVGVKTDYPPFGMLAADGSQQGFEHELAAEIAKRLGVKLRKVSVTGSNRLQKLQEGVIDLVIATTGDTSERRQIVTMIEPNYYASGVTLFMPPGSKIKDWAETRAQQVCATQGSYFNRIMQQRYLMDLQMYNNARDAKLAVKEGRCIGYLFDNTAVLNDLANPEWRGYKAPLAPTLSTPWAMAISKSEQGSEFERLLGDIVAEWHRNGFLLEREKAWGLPASKFLSDSHKLWQSLDDNGQPYCQRLQDGNWRAECRNQIFLTSNDVGGLAQLGLWLNETTGINLTMIYDDYDRKQFLQGLLLTLFLTVLCILTSLMLGWVGAVLAESRHKLIALPAIWLGTIGRMTPPLLCMYLLFFGVGSLIYAWSGYSLPAIAVVVICLSVYTGAGVMTGLRDAAQTYRHKYAGHTEFRLRFGNTWQIARLASGSVTATLINVAKATMMASALAVPELMSACTAIINERGNVGVMMNALLLTFLVLIYVVVRSLRQLEQKILARVAS